MLTWKNHFSVSKHTFSRSSTIYNTSARHEQRKCKTGVTRATRVQHEWNTSNISVTQVQHKCYRNDTSVTRVKKINFDNYTSKNIFSHSYIYYMTSERLQEEGKFYSKYCLCNNLIPKPKCIWKVHDKSWNL